MRVERVGPEIEATQGVPASPHRPQPARTDRSAECGQSTRSLEKVWYEYSS